MNLMDEVDKIKNEGYSEANAEAKLQTVWKWVDWFCTLLKGMIYKETSSQYSFHTEKGISLLRKVDI